MGFLNCGVSCNWASDPGALCLWHTVIMASIVQGASKSSWIPSPSYPPQWISSPHHLAVYSKNSSPWKGMCDSPLLARQIYWINVLKALLYRLVPRSLGWLCETKCQSELKAPWRTVQFASFLQVLLTNPSFSENGAEGSQVWGHPVQLRVTLS